MWLHTEGAAGRATQLVVVLAAFGLTYVVLAWLRYGSKLRGVLSPVLRRASADRDLPSAE